MTLVSVDMTSRARIDTPVAAALAGGQEDRRRLQLEGWTYDAELVPWSTSHDQEDEPVHACQGLGHQEAAQVTRARDAWPLRLGWK
jgi:hypothetical protein